MRKPVQIDFFDKIFDSQTSKNFVGFDKALTFFKNAENEGQKILTVTVVCGGYIVEQTKNQKKK